MKTVIKRLLEDYPRLRICEEDLYKTLDVLATSFQEGGKLLLCGNGGSCADCEHIVGELMKGFRLPRKLSTEDRAALQAVGAPQEMADALQGALPAISLTGHTALSSAFLNDVDASFAFAQQVWGYGRPGDVLLGLSTSGNAKNVGSAALAAKARGMRVLGLTGEGGGHLATLCDVCIRVPEKETYRIQELHLPVYHALCEALEKHFFG